MERKVKYFLVSLVLCIGISCDKSGVDSIIETIPEKKGVDNGIFVGAVFVGYPTAYSVVNNKAVPLGWSAELKRIDVINGTSFKAVPKSEYHSEFICREVKISKSDYKPADSEETKSFGGLWYAPYRNDKTPYDEGLVMGIKPIDNGYWEITFANPKGDYGKTKDGQILMINDHQELTFTLPTEISGRENQVWVLTTLSIDGNELSKDNLTLKAQNDDSEGFFEFTAIHNVL